MAEVHGFDMNLTPLEATPISTALTTTIKNNMADA
jgi:hypothetical protein